MSTISTGAAQGGSAVHSPIRVPYLVVSLAAFLLFGLAAYEVYGHPLLSLDISVERAVQATAWGPLTVAFAAIDWLDGYKQIAAAVIGILVAFLVNRRATFLAIWFALSAAAYTLTELFVRRPRPGADLVHVIRHASGFGFPSGHAVFYTWFLGLLLLTVGRRFLAGPAYAAAWVIAALFLVLVCIGRVYTAEHWPSDVLAGVLLGVGWMCLGLSIRKLSDPVLEHSDAR